MKTVALLLSLTMFVNGCSMLFVRPPRPGGGGAGGQAGCTTNKVAPVLDTMFAGWQVVRIGIAATASEDAYRGKALSQGADIMIGVLLGIVGASSAVYGFKTVDECRGRGESVNPYAPRATTRTRQQRAADEAAEEAAVQARSKARAAQAAEAEEDDDDEDAPSVVPVPTPRPDAGR